MSHGGLVPRPSAKGGNVLIGALLPHPHQVTLWGQVTPSSSDLSLSYLGPPPLCPSAASQTGSDRWAAEALPTQEPVWRLIDPVYPSNSCIPRSLPKNKHERPPPAPGCPQRPWWGPASPWARSYPLAISSKGPGPSLPRPSMQREEG